MNSYEFRGSRLTFDADESLWICGGFGAELHYAFSGLLEAPDSVALDLANSIFSQLSEIGPIAVRFLADLLDPTKFYPVDEWDLEGFIFRAGDKVDSSAVEVSLCHHGDTYGTWRVTFRASKPAELEGRFQFQPDTVIRRFC